MLIASSPIEIEAKADEAGLAPAAHDAAIRLFHHLTDRIGQAVVALAINHEEWPKHRFYFAADPAELAGLLSALRDFPDIVEVSDAVPARAPSGDSSGLFASATEGSFSGVMVAHEDHARYHGGNHTNA